MRNPFNQPASPSGSFIPEDYLQRQIERRHIAVNLILLGSVFCGVTGAFAVTNRQWSSVKAQQQDINVQYTAEAKKIEQLKLLETQKDEMLDKAEIASMLIERVPRSILLAEVTNRLPAPVTLTELTLASKRIKDPAPDPKAAAKNAAPAAKPQSLAGKPAPAKPGAPAPASKPGAPPAPEEKPRPPRMEFTVSLTGLSPTDEDVADFHSALKACPLLERCDLVSSTATTVNDQPLRKFRVEAVIRPGADARLIEPLTSARGRSPFAPEHKPGVPAPGGPVKSVLDFLFANHGGGDK